MASAGCKICGEKQPGKISPGYASLDIWRNNMFFISKREFEEKVRERFDEAMRRHEEYERFDRLRESIYKLECRVNKLEHPGTKDERDEMRACCGGGGN
jgi:hypothetical protein